MSEEVTLKQDSHFKASKPIQAPRKDGITALYLGCKTNELPGFPKPIWLPIYRFSWDDDGYYYYSYTKAFYDNQEQLKGHVVNPECGLNKLWKTKYLDSIFSKTIPRRADSMIGYHWFGISEKQGDHIAYLARSGSSRVGDNYSIFPEVRSDRDGYYNFYFSLVDVQCSEKDDMMSQDKKNLTKLLSLEFQSEKEQTAIIYRSKKIGFCPEYIHYLLNSPIYKGYQLHIDQINKDNIIVRAKLSFDSIPWLLRDFQPLNPMPV